jgi:hypothetical protein
MVGLPYFYASTGSKLLALGARFKVPPGRDAEINVADWQ